MKLNNDTEFIAVATASAAALPRLYAEKRKKNLSEQFHLQPATNLVVERLAPTWDPAPSLVGKKFGEKLGWIGLGHVDNVFHWGDGTRTFLELKCGQDMSACVWDSVKLASGLLNGNARAGYLLAGAPTSCWRKPVRGAELFRSAIWRTAGVDVRDAYLDWWRRWEAEMHIPGRVAASFQTFALGSFSFEIDGIAWELRLARVEPMGSSWIEWQPVTG